MPQNERTWEAKERTILLSRSICFGDNIILAKTAYKSKDVCHIPEREQEWIYNIKAELLYGYNLEPLCATISSKRLDESWE